MNIGSQSCFNSHFASFAVRNQGETKTIFPDGYLLTNANNADVQSHHEVTDGGFPGLFHIVAVVLHQRPNCSVFLMLTVLYLPHDELEASKSYYTPTISIAQFI